jgi:type I restriction enzyme M protein
MAHNRNIGETLDVNRFPIDENDLKEAVSLFNQFKGAAKTFKTDSKRCKIQPIDEFDPDKHWSIDRWWSKADKIELGIVEDDVIINIEDFKVKVKEIEYEIHKLSEELEAPLVGTSLQPSVVNRDISLSDKIYFKLFIGKRVLFEEVFKSTGTVPLYSANVIRPFGYVKESNVEDLSNNHILWGIDGNFEFSIKRKGEIFATTDHCGAIKILDDSIIPEFLLYQLEQKKHEYGFDRTLRASITNMKMVTLSIPVNDDGTFDQDVQRKIAQKYIAVKEMRDELAQQLQNIINTVVEI